MFYDKSLCVALAVAAAAFFLSACDKADSADTEQAQPAESAHTVDWYKDHYDTAKEKSDWCKQDAARKMTSDCMNAMEAVASVRLYGKDDEWHLPDITYKGNSSKQKESREEFDFPDVTSRLSDNKGNSNKQNEPREEFDFPDVTSHISDKSKD